MINKLVVPIGGMVALAAASIYYGEPQKAEVGRSATTPAVLTATPETPAPTTTLNNTVPALGVTEAAAAVSRATTGPVVLPQPATRKVAAAQNAEENDARAAALREADTEMQPAGFGAACFDQMRAFFCPIFGRIPVMREMAAQMATIGGFSCPLGSPPATGT